MEDVGKLLLRMTVGILILFHAYAFLSGDPGIPNSVAAWGFPSFVAYVAFLMETIGAMFVILGIFTEVGALGIVLFMLAAIIMYHSTEIQGLRGSGNHLFLRGMNPAGTHRDKYFLEAQAFYLFGALSVALLGAGRYRIGRWFMRAHKLG
jgi:putative oxidoreductase